ncbi:preprocathepsin c precursor [Cystoisospora suis]|uniref:Dipeptidyl peptidase 1 n=1 Tax=Cystoisospora suis TaxID=483139 RepID=A0A2C6LGS1_9APIC|nr:preprocathepsin c precursor [Cystoisospora suis]
MKLLGLGVFAAGGLSLVRADLPIHGLMADVLGTWTFTLGAEDSEHPTSCGGGGPNYNLENLQPALDNYGAWLESHSQVERKLKLTLTDKLVPGTSEVAPRNTWNYLAVTVPSQPDTAVGTWTMVYDEGFEVRLPDRRFFALLKYSRKDAAECPRKLNGDNEDAFGETKCYVTDPTRTHIGWTVKEYKENMHLMHTWSCFYGEKEEAAPEKKSVVLENSAYRLPTLPTLESLTEGLSVPGRWTATVHQQFADVSPRDLSLYKGQSGFKKYHPLVDYALPTFLQKDRFGKMDARKGFPKQALTSRFRDRRASPRTWGDPFLLESWNPSADRVINQGSCGSCYAVSSAYVLQKRFEILFNKLFPGANLTAFESPLSAQSILSCSPYNQGCDGGYPFLVGKHAKEFGFGTEQCQKYNATHDPRVAPCLMNIGSVTRTPEHSAPGCGPGDRWYAKDYNYVGGFYEGCSEDKMMHEIFHHGPVVVAIDAPDTLFMYHDGLFDSQPPEHGKICDITKPGFNGWEYTNHAVAVVGWGEEPARGGEKPRKFWVVRNTWGSDWGNGGYMKMPRGENMAAIESQAVYFDPDLTRGKAAKLIEQFRKRRDA